MKGEPQGEKPPRFFIRQITEHSWCLQERTIYNIDDKLEWGYGYPFPAAQHCTTKAEAIAWIRYVVTGDMSHVSGAGEPLIMGAPTYYDDEGCLLDLQLPPL